MYAPKNRYPKHLQQTLTELQGEMDSLKNNWRFQYSTAITNKTSHIAENRQRYDRQQHYQPILLK